MNAAAVQSVTPDPAESVGTQLVHYEHPDLRWEAWCGSESLGISTTARATCPDCVRLHRENPDSWRFR